MTDLTPIAAVVKRLLEALAENEPAQVLDSEVIPSGNRPTEPVPDSSEEPPNKRTRRAPGR